MPNYDGISKNNKSISMVVPNRETKKEKKSTSCDKVSKKPGLRKISEVSELTSWNANVKASVGKPESVVRQQS